jgi:blue copper oxidase
MKIKSLPLLFSLSVGMLFGCTSGWFSEPFDREVVIPPLLENTGNIDGTKAYQLIAQQGETVILDSTSPTPTLGYNGTYLGPTIRSFKGDTIQLQVRNNLTENTTVHWHGFEIPGSVDGGPHQVIEPQTIWSPTFQVQQEAFTGWYHPHGMGSTATQVYAGLAGVWIHDDLISQSLAIPQQYGVNDFPLVIQDRLFNEDGTFNYAPTMMDGIHGDKVLINGVYRGRLNVPKGLVRLRFINGANSTTFDLRMNRYQSMTMIASDGGLLSEPIKKTFFRISPGERVEIIADLSNVKPSEYISLFANNKRVMDLMVTDQAIGYEPIPQTLTTITRYDKAEATKRRSFSLQTFGMISTINGLRYNEHRIDFTTNHHSKEVWTIKNEASMMHSTGHPFHIHGVRFQVISRQGGPPPKHELGWKDTILVSPNETVEIMLQFHQLGIFMYHCHLLEHEEHGMMGQFSVLES